MSGEHEKAIKKMKYGENMLKAILYFSRNERDFEFPTKKEFILSEVVNGTIDYLTETAGEITYKKLNSDERKGFVQRIDEYFKKETKRLLKKLDPKVSQELTALVGCKEEERGDLFGGSILCDTTKLYEEFSGEYFPICPVSRMPIFSLLEETIRHVEKKVIPTLAESELKDIKGIGKAMRKYINEDLEYIKKS